MNRIAAIAAASALLGVPGARAQQVEVDRLSDAISLAQLGGQIESDAAFCRAPSVLYRSVLDRAYATSRHLYNQGSSKPQDIRPIIEVARRNQQALETGRDPARFCRSFRRQVSYLDNHVRVARGQQPRPLAPVDVSDWKL